MSAHRRDKDYLYDVWEAMQRVLAYTAGWTVISRDIPAEFPRIEEILRREGGLDEDDLDI